jgi:hypothetical protein
LVFGYGKFEIRPQNYGSPKKRFPTFADFCRLLPVFTDFYLFLPTFTHTKKPGTRAGTGLGEKNRVKMKCLSIP